MNSSLIGHAFRSPPLRIGLLCAVLSICAHTLFLAWARGSIELPTWNAPIRDTPVQVALVEPKRDQPVVAENAPAPPKAVIKTTRPRSPAVKVAPKIENNEVNAATSSPDTTALPVTSRPETSLGKEVLKENTPEANNPPVVSSPNGEQGTTADLYPGGLGVLKESAAHPYKFYFGDYTDNNVLGSAYFVVESTATDYKLAIVGKASGLTSLLYSGATYRSEGVFNNDGFAPTRYAERSGNRAERQSTVDYSSREITLGDQKKPVLQGLQDRVSVIWQVGLVLRARPEFAQAGKSLPIPLMSTRSIDLAQFVSRGVVSLERNGKSIQAVHFRFEPVNDKNKAQIDLWYEIDKLPQPLRVRWIDERQRTIDIFRDDKE